MNVLTIKNGVDSLTMAEQKTILSASAYYIVSENLLFNCLILKYDGGAVSWTPPDIDAAIVYLKKNNITQTI